ncbi:Gfo/Idh/MocA family oxidoreductase [Nonomuraea sp. 3-1Str]|uniref:Gfo/Idh/MocA family protein n=1 Tax=Nonomuraea sp. 3-1Str TaxID=2929801 RepID=UPI00285E57B6|nr:Gfo/Idh/MocA family oxidoreductase [Nonomuraea sp. 3-1Str]MDR8412035.1 Gfo/Idh/MocA family oxidoreductase [Nonomuraea sp. 3-1Str]
MTPHSGPARIAIVGSGGIAGVQADDLARMDGAAELVAAVDVDADRVAAFARTWDIPRAYTRLEDLLQDAECDVVHLCSPPALHREQAIAVLERGWSVLSEKPPALSLREFDEITAAEARSPGFFATVSQHRFGGRAVAVREAIARGEYGPLRLALCDTLWFRPDSYFEVPWRGTWESEGGGPTLGHGIHQMDLLLSLAGPWASVRAVAERKARATDTEDLSVATVTLESGATVVAVNSLLSARETSHLRFDFERATVELEHLYGYGDDAWRLTPAPGGDPEVAARWKALPEGRPSGHSAQFEAVIDALRTGAAPPVASVDARQTLELIAAIYASAFTGEEVARGQITEGSPFHASMGGGRVPWLTRPDERQGR